LDSASSLSPKSGFSETLRESQSLSPNNNKNEFTFWLIFGLSPNLGFSESLRERLFRKVK